jgi:type I restriction enzyme S subunit
MTFPKNWEKTKMGDIGRYLNGKAFKSEEWKSTGRPIIRIQNLTGSGSEYNYFQGEVEDRYVVMPGDLLFSWSATLGTFIWKGPEAVLNQHIFKVESYIDKKFHRYLLDFKIQEMQSQTHGSGMVHITKKSFDAIEVHIPSIDEQHKIVELLEDHLSRLDAALADVKQAKLKAAQFRRSLLLSLMSPDDAGSSSDWTRTTLGNVCDLVAGKTPPSLESSINGIDDSSRTVPFYKVGDMNLHSEFLCESRLYLSAKQVEDRKLFVLPIGSVVFPKAGGAIATNKKRVISVPGPIDLNCMAAIPIEGTNPRYLSWWFHSINLSTYADGSILPQLSKGKMSEIPVDWPSQKLQEGIVLRIEQSLSKNSEAIKLAEAIEANSSSLRRSLLQSAFTGQLAKEVVNV